MLSKLKSLKEKINENTFLKNVKKYNYSPKTEEEYLKILKKKAYEKQPDLNDIDVSNLEYVGYFSKFIFFKKNNFFVDEWNVSKVKMFNETFEECKVFNSGLSQWDTSNGLDFNHFFYKCQKFNQPILNFDISNAEKIYGFFRRCSSFNQDLYNFKFNFKVNDLERFFMDAWKFNQDISMWDVSNIEYFDSMFENTYNFKQDISKWNDSKAKYWENVFRNSKISKYPELQPKRLRIPFVYNSE